MTAEKAKEILYREWQEFLENNIDYAGVSDAYKLAFKALEQMSVIEDIKSEIRSIQPKWHENAGKHNCIDEVIKIIDKHISGKETVNGSN